MCHPLRGAFTLCSHHSTLFISPHSSVGIPRPGSGSGPALVSVRSIYSHISSQLQYQHLSDSAKICGALNKMTNSSVDNSTCSLAQLAPIEAVLFDVDGTLCDSDPLHLIAFQELLPQIGFNGGVPIDEQFYNNNFSGKHNDEIATFLFPDDFEKGVKFCEDKEAIFRKLAKEKLKAVKGLDKLVKWIEERGLKRAAVTNAPKPNAIQMIAAVGLTDFFETVVLGCECERAKPYPDPYLKALEILKVSKEHTFIFEDSFSGTTAGVAAGMSVIALTTGNPAELLMKAKPAFLIKDYEDPKLWAALDELDRIGAVKKVAS